METHIQTIQESLGRKIVKPTDDHVSLGLWLRTIVFLVPMLALVWILYSMAAGKPEKFPAAIGIGVTAGIVWGVLISGIRVAAQWERGVILRLGKFRTVRGPGLMYVVPIVEYVRFIDTRTLVCNIPHQKVITRDNVPALIDGVLFFMVTDSEKAVTRIQDFRFAMSQYSQAAMRDVIGGMTLDEVLSERQQIQNKIGEHVEERIRDWGLHVDSIRLQDIELPEDLKRVMSRQASAEREKRATITKAEGDKLAADNLSQAAATMAKNAMSMQLRTLQTIDGLGASPSNTVVLFPLELCQIGRMVESMGLNKK